MAKQISAQVKLQLLAGKATPGPPVGSSLGPHGINIAAFVKEFNDRTANQEGMTIPVVITIYKDRSFEFITKVPPVAALIKKAIGLKSGSAKPNKEKVGKITRAQVTEIAKAKMVDMNAASVEAAERIVIGTAKSMGVTLAD